MIINNIKIFKKFLSSKSSKYYNIIFIYGSNNNLIDKYTNIYIKHKNFDIKNPFSTIYINPEDINHHPEILYNAIYTYNIFYNYRLIWIRNANIKKEFALLLKKLALSRIENVSLIIESVNIKKKDLIIDILSSSENAIVIPCYKEDVNQINDTINQMLSDFNINISKETKNFLLNMLKNNSPIMTNELEKIFLYMINNKYITKNDILSIFNNEIIFTKNDIFKIILLGNIDNFLKYFDFYCNKFSSILDILHIIQNMFYKILKIRLLIEDNKYDKKQIVVEIKNEFFLYLQIMIEKLVYIWDSKKIFYVIEKIQKCILNIRKYPKIKLYIIREILLEITIESNKLIINYNNLL